MECSDQRRHDEEKARAAMEQMSDEALAGLIDMMQDAAKRSPRLARTSLSVVKNKKETGPKK